MTSCPWSQLGVKSVKHLALLDAEDFDALKKSIVKIPYKLLLKGMTRFGFDNVPSVPTCPQHSHGTSALTPSASGPLLKPRQRRRWSRPALRSSSIIDEPVIGKRGLRMVGAAVKEVDHLSTPRLPRRRSGPRTRRRSRRSPGKRCVLGNPDLRNQPVQSHQACEVGRYPQFGLRVMGHSVLGEVRRDVMKPWHEASRPPSHGLTPNARDTCHFIVDWKQVGESNEADLPQSGRGIHNR